MSTPKPPAVIATKGTKGFLAWLALNQGPLYDAALPQLKALAAQQGATGAAKPTFQGLGDDSVDPTVSIDNSGTVPDATINIDSGVVVPPTAALSLYPPSVSFPPDSPVTSATTGPTSNQVAASIASIIGSVAAGAQAISNIQTQNQLTNIQLSRAQAGLAPLNINPASLGLPYGTSTSVSGSISTPLMLFGLGALALLVLPGLFKKKS
jgi:hypothetical protein